MCRMDCNCINRKIFVYVYERIAEIHSPRYTWVSRQTLELLFTCLFCCCSTVALYYLSCIFVCVLPRLMTLPAAHFCDACRTWNTHESRVLSMYTTSTTIHIMMMIIIVVCFFFFGKEFLEISKQLANGKSVASHARNFHCFNIVFLYLFQVKITFCPCLVNESVHHFP